MDESHAVGVMAKARTVQLRCLAVRLRVTSLMSYPACVMCELRRQ